MTTSSIYQEGENVYVIFEESEANRYVPTFVSGQENEKAAVNHFINGIIGSRKYSAHNLVVAHLGSFTKYDVEPTFDVASEKWLP